jgi:hypothetical protein
VITEERLRELERQALNRITMPAGAVTELVLAAREMRDPAIERSTIEELLTKLGYGDDLRRVGVYEVIRNLHARAR